MTANSIQFFALALFLAAICACGEWIKLPGRFARHQRNLLSFSAGISVAYVFVHLLPEVEVARAVLVRSTMDWSVQLPAYIVSLAVLAGFMFFYGLECLIVRSSAPDDRTDDAARGRGLDYRLHIGISGIYAAMISYLRINAIEHGEVPVLLFALAMGTHFLTMDHGLRRKYGASYARRGHIVLAGAPIIGWAFGV